MPKWMTLSFYISTGHFPMGLQLITNNDRMKIKSQVFKSVICDLILVVLEWKFTKFYFPPFKWPNTGFYAFSFSSEPLTFFSDNVNNSNQSSDHTVSLCLISKKMSTSPNPGQSPEFWTDGFFKHLSTPQCNIIHLNRHYALPKTGNLFSLIQWKKRGSETIPLTFCSCIWALTTLNSADGGFWLATRSSVSMSQLSRDSRASWNLPQWRRASCNCAARWATWENSTGSHLFILFLWND